MEANCFTILYCFCHASTWIRHTIPLGHPSAPTPSILYHASNLDWWFISHMIIYVFQCHSPKSSHPRPLQSPKDYSVHLCLFCCLAYRVIVTISLWPHGTAARQASLSITNSRSLFKLTSIQSVMPSNHFICDVSDAILNLLPHNLFLSLFCLFQNVV